VEEADRLAPIAANRRNSFIAACALALAIGVGVGNWLATAPTRAIDPAADREAVLELRLDYRLAKPPVADDEGLSRRP
jgi:hypothetical protein